MEDARHPFDVDLILSHILSFLDHPKDLLACRAVSTKLWTAATHKLNEKGVRLALDHRTIQEYHDGVVSGGWTLTPFLDLNIHLTGNESENTDCVKYAALLIEIGAAQTDSNGDPKTQRRIREIRLNASDEVDAEPFWKLLQATAPHLEDLRVQEAGFDDIVPRLAEPTTTKVAWPSLTRLYLDLALRPNASLSTHLTEMANASPNLKVLSLAQIQPDVGERLDRDTTPCTVDFLSKLTPEASSRIKELELAIYEMPHESIDDGLPAYQSLITELNRLGFNQLQCLKIHQHFGFFFLPRFRNFMANVQTLTTLEYYYINKKESGTPITFHDFAVTDTGVNDRDWGNWGKSLPKITHFGFYYMATGAGVSFEEHKRKEVEFEDVERRITTMARGNELPSLLEADLGRKREVSHMVRLVMHAMQMPRTCPNLVSLSCDVYAFMAYACLSAEEPFGLYLPCFGGPVGPAINIFSDMNFPLISTLTVKVPVFKRMDGDKNAARQTLSTLSPEFAAKLTHRWSKACPLLNKLVVDFISWDSCACHQQQVLSPGNLPALLGLGGESGLEELEIHNYYQDWLGELLEQEPWSVPKLTQNLKKLTLLTPAYKIVRRCEEHQAMAIVPVLRDLYGLIDAFTKLEELTVELDACGETVRANLDLDAGVSRDKSIQYKNTTVHFI